ncbi:hypothetical protein Cst_c01800 [Thermoclostridium stercorarium subsp. stercorarium DSM 8532]|uniref:Uncharacterized protein n=1 Tax=Thermoclostridium stercorarium (strain ATCC 35414 / DSM 8532 / NCIMB 11754) TaxID=1121335 RepID=L7VGW1_THES1|nr:hypothetical protein Cst_c01800 [Thermoclostridium stercorarium subsp. stercorarium DSM 8532]
MALGIKTPSIINYISKGNAFRREISEYKIVKCAITIKIYIGVLNKV